MTGFNTGKAASCSRARHALKSLASFGYLAFAGLAHEASAKDLAHGGGLAPRQPHFPARAKRVIFLCMNGGPSHVDLFDYKPELNKRSGAASTVGRERGGAHLLGSPFQFAQHGQSGLWMSEILPHLAGQADDLCVVRSMHTDLPNHAQAFIQLHTGSFQFVRPSVGAWTLYGLGSENANLPGFVTVNPPSDNGGSRNYGNGFLSAIFQGTRIGTNQIPGFYAAFLKKDQEPGPPLKNIENKYLSHDMQRAQLDLVRDLNRRKLEHDVYHPEIEGAIESFELAFRMQDEVPQVLDMRSESPATLKLYGVGPGLPTDRFGRQCILARRLAEAGVRFIEITAPGSWDHHFMLKEELTKSCAGVDQPLAALLIDLKQRGLLQDTLVVWEASWPHPYAERQWSRSQQQGSRSDGGGGAWLAHAHRRVRPSQAVEKPMHIRLARHGAAPARSRPRTAHVPLRRRDFRRPTSTETW